MVFLSCAVAGYAAYKTLLVPHELYAVSGRFAGCSEAPSCVSSVAEDDDHRVPALGYTSDPYFAMLMLEELVTRMGGRIDHESPNYLHAVFESPVMRFRDDLELLVLPNGRVEVRSAARLGYKDFGVNRARVEELRRSFEALP